MQKHLQPTAQIPSAPQPPPGGKRYPQRSPPPPHTHSVAHTANRNTWQTENQERRQTGIKKGRLAGRAPTQTADDLPAAERQVPRRAGLLPLPMRELPLLPAAALSAPLALPDPCAQAPPATPLATGPTQGGVELAASMHGTSGGGQAAVRPPLLAASAAVQRAQVTPCPHSTRPACWQPAAAGVAAAAAAVLAAARVALQWVLRLAGSLCSLSAL